MDRRMDGQTGIVIQSYEVDVLWSSTLKESFTQLKEASCV